MEFPTIDKFAKDVAEKALDEFIYEGKTIREWVELLVKKQPCDDAISRETVIEWLKDKDIIKTKNQEENARRELADLPPVTPLPKTGHWIRWYEQKENDGCIEHIPHCKCSECGKEYDPHSSQFVKYCNKCGAKMEVEK